MSWEAWYTLAVTAVVVAVLVRDLLAPSAAFIGAMVAVLVPGIVTTEQAFSGFSNPAPITIAAMYVLARAVEMTGALQPIVSATLGDEGGARSALARLMVPAAGASAFINNTPIVAMLVPQVERWAEGRGWSPSTFLMPLSFAAILGGLVTVIGTASNLVVSGLFEAAGMEPMGFFEITKVGLPVAAAGMLLVVALAPAVLPPRRSVRQDVGGDIREFAVDMVVIPDGPLDGVTVEEGSLRHLSGVFLVELERSGELIAPVSPRTRLHGGDRLRFYGRPGQIVDLQAMRGLVSAERDHVMELDTARSAYFEAVVGAASPLAGRTLREAGFRERYQAAVVAIHRAGHRVDSKLGSVRLRVGDTLLILADPGFRARWHDHNHFLLIAPLAGSPAPVTRGASRVGLVLAGVVALAVSGATPLVSAVLLGAVAMVLAGVLTPQEARHAVNFDVILMIAAAIGFASALQESGLAGTIAEGVVDVFGTLGDLGVLLGVVLVTIALTELVANSASALLVFPVAVSSAAALGLNPRAFGMAVAVAAASSFLTPIGYQTNIMVYGPGGYRFADYARLGLPVSLATIGIVVALVPVFWPL